MDSDEDVGARQWFMNRETDRDSCQINYSSIRDVTKLKLTIEIFLPRLSLNSKLEPYRNNYLISI